MLSQWAFLDQYGLNWSFPIIHYLHTTFIVLRALHIFSLSNYKLHPRPLATYFIHPIFHYSSHVLTSSHWPPWCSQHAHVRFFSWVHSHRYLQSLLPHFCRSLLQCHQFGGPSLTIIFQIANSPPPSTPWSSLIFLASAYSYICYSVWNSLISM